MLKRVFAQRLLLYLQLYDNIQLFVPQHSS